MKWNETCNERWVVTKQKNEYEWSKLIWPKYIIKVIIDNKIFKKLKMMSFTVIFFVATFLKDVGMLELEMNKGWLKAYH